MLRRFFSVASLAENSLSLRSLRSGAQFFARRSFHFPTAPLIVRFSFFLPLGFRKLFFFASLKFLAYGGRQKFFCLPPLPYESSAGGSPLIKFARTASRFCVAEKPFFCKLYSRSPAFCTAAVLSRPNVGRSKIFLLRPTFGPIHKSSRAVSARLSLFYFFLRSPFRKLYSHTSCPVAIIPPRSQRTCGNIPSKALFSYSQKISPSSGHPNFSVIVQ